jgi:TrmH family RNA methyltransferase
MVSRALTKRLRALSRRKERDRSGLLLAEGPRVVEDLLDAGAEVSDCLYAMESVGQTARAAVSNLIERLNAAGVGCQKVSSAELADLSDTVTPQGILVSARIPRYDWNDILQQRILLVDGVQDPGNLGTLIRTAEALGAGGVILLPGTVDPWSPKSVRAASGSSFRLPILELGHRETIDGLAARDVPIWASAADGRPLSRSQPTPERVAIAVGNEGAGISAEIRAAAQRIVAIEQAGETESLNVAIAAAILLDRILGGAGAGSD